MPCQPEPPLWEKKGFEFHLWITRQPKTIPPFELKHMDNELSQWGPEFESPEKRFQGSKSNSGMNSTSTTGVKFTKSGITEEDFFRVAWEGREEWVGNFCFHRGRPKWDIIFPEVRKKHEGACKKIAVPICGPKVLGNALKEKCAQYSDKDFEFVLHRENF